MDRFGRGLGAISELLSLSLGPDACVAVLNPRTSARGSLARNKFVCANHGADAGAAVATEHSEHGACVAVCHADANGNARAQPTSRALVKLLVYEVQST